MPDIESIFNAMSEAARRDRSQYHVTLGELIDVLTGLESSLPVVFPDGASPGPIDSYRGFYADLAIQPITDDVRVEDLLKRLKDAVDEVFEGYKGGEFLMGEDTPLWRSVWGTSSGLAVIAVQANDERVLLETKKIE